MVVVLRVMFVAFSLLTAFLISRRYLVARMDGDRERLELQPEG
jgi:hypothetical protein